RTRHELLVGGLVHRAHVAAVEGGGAKDDAPVATALFVAVEVAARGGDLHGVFAPGAMVGLGVDLALGAVAFNDEQRIADAVHGDLVVGAVLRHQVHEPLRGPVVYTSAILHGTLVVDA